MMLCRLLVDPPQDGAWNMAVDEALLDDAADGGKATLRFYQWRQPTLSLGYFQAYRDRQTHAASRGAAVVRRLSGGGALMHDRELTYSLCLPAAHPLSREASSLYGIVHRALIGVLKAQGLSPALQCETQAMSPTTDEPFLCFSRRSDVDVVLPSRISTSPSAKIVGSAQRRRRGAVLQHGAVLLDTSRFAPELSGVKELTGKALTPSALSTAWQQPLATALQLQLEPYQLEGALFQSAQRLESDKYGQASWTDRR